MAEGLSRPLGDTPVLESGPCSLPADGVLLSSSILGPWFPPL